MQPEVLEVSDLYNGILDSHEIHVRASGCVIGELDAERVTVEGLFKGTIKASEVVVEGTAIVEGELHYEHLVIADGARVDARFVPC